MITTRASSAALVLAIVVSACGSGEVVETTGGGISLPTTGPTTSTQSPATTEASDTPTATSSTISVEDVVPALGVSVAASDSFDADHLIRGAGSSFVPMDDPDMVEAADVTWLDPDSVVMGLTHSSGEAHAYPVGQMAYHHIANTTIAGEPFLVTY